MRHYLKFAAWAPVVLLVGCADNAAPTKPAASAGPKLEPAATVAAATEADTPKAVDKAPAGTLAITPTNSKIAWVGTKPEGKHDGGFAKFSGYIEKGASGLAGGKIVVDIDVESLTSDNPKLTGHLKSPDFFDARTHPKASFKSKKIEAAKGADATHTVTGELTLHGVTKEISFPAKVTESADGVKLESKFTIDRTEFGMTYGPGKVDNPVTIMVSVDAKKA